MSTNELVIEATKLLESSWLEHEKNLVKRVLDNMISYKSLIPKALKKDIRDLLIMANRIKTEYDNLIISTTLTLTSTETEPIQKLEINEENC